MRHDNIAILTSGMAVCLGFAILAGGHASAELETIQVGGALYIYGDATRNVYASGDGLRRPAYWLTGRPVGAGPFNADGLVSWADWDDGAADEAQITLWARLHVRADFSSKAAAFIEFEHLGGWGESFRSAYLSGADRRVNSETEVGLYQGYLEIAEVWDAPLSVRLGRQELSFGSEWLVGNNSSGPAPNYGLSFDAVRLSYESDWLRLDAFAAKLAERMGDFGQEDEDFYGLYLTYSGFEGHAADVYWLLLRDDAPLESYPAGPLAEWTQRALGLDQYRATELHTVGARVSGAFGRFDYELEAARQFGDAGQVGAWFQPALYGDTSATFDAWGMNSEIGFTFPLPWQPRVYGAYAYLSGEDRRDITFGQWLRSLTGPFYTAPASVSFNRLFSNKSYTYVLEASDLSNAHIASVGTAFSPSDKLELDLRATYLRTAAAFHRPVAPFLSFWTRKNDPELGWQLDMSAAYYYTEELYLAAGWSRLFTGKGLREGHYNSSNGLDFNGGANDKTADYAYFELGLSF